MLSLSVSSFEAIKVHLFVSPDPWVDPFSSAEPLSLFFFDFSSFFSPACLVDLLLRLSFLFMAHFHLVADPSLQCHLCRGLFFIHRRWSFGDQLPVSGCTASEPEWGKGRRPLVELEGWREAL